MKKINKRQARKEFYDGKKVGLLPCNVTKDNRWMSICWIDADSRSDNDRDFDQIVNEFEYYSCNNEMGRYAAYYIND